jgi:hypothetical protein
MHLFDPLVPDTETSPLFQAVRDHWAYEPARRLMERVFVTYPKAPKEEFVRDFQSHGFSARVWELALFAYFAERDFETQLSRGSPDFLVTLPGQVVAVEATTSNPPRAAKEAPRQSISELLAEPDRDTKTEAIFQCAKALRRKLQWTGAGGARYWDLASIRGRPFVLAVEAFYHPFSLSQTLSPIASYVYGFEYTTSRTTEGKLIVTPSEIQEHVYGGKSIPSAFFKQPDAENISAILFSNSATLSQFQRMGIEYGYGVPGVTVIRGGSCYQADVDADRPAWFQYEVTAGEHREDFAQGLTLLHNPWARIRLRRGLFTDISEGWLSRENLVNFTHPAFAPFESVTGIVAARDPGPAADTT